MRYRAWCVVFIGLLAADVLQALDRLTPGDTVAICGDSITQQKLYSVYLETYLLACQPAQNLSAHQFGWGGEAIGGLSSRLVQEVLPFKPTVATTCYAMNDGGYLPIDPKRQADFEHGTKEVIQKLKAGGVRFIVVGTDGVVDTDTFLVKPGKPYPAEEYNTKTLANLADIARRVAAAENVIYADVHEPMSKVMRLTKEKYGHAYHLAGPDGVHPAANGHFVMAYAFLKALGCDGDIGTIDLDYRGNHASATEGHRVISYANGHLELESTKYPFCTYGDKTSPNSARGVLEFLPFNEELNRFRLVVRNPPSARLKITWGATSKEFSAVDLAKGINLAAEFPDNPFNGPFNAVQAAVAKQQIFETPAVQSVLHSLPGWSTTMPEEKNAFDSLAKSVIAKSRELAAAAQATVVPVKYTIDINPIP